MKFLIAYDVFDNKRRRKIAKIAYSYSESYQKSALEVDVSKHELKGIIKEMREIYEDEDIIGFYSFRNVLKIGKNEDIEWLI